MTKHHFVMLSDVGYGIPIALRLQDEGNIVDYACDPTEVKDKDKVKAYQRMGNGLVHKLPWKTLVNNLKRKAEKLKERLIVIFDGNHHSKLADSLRGLGYRVIGSGSFFDKLEHDRKFRLKTAKQCQMNMPESYEFKSVEKGIKFLKSQPKKKPFAFKPNDADSHLAFDTDDNKELIEYLECYKKECKKPFVLQQKIKGIEVSAEGWFNGTNFVFFDATLERHRKSAGDLGRMNGCVGDVAWELSSSSRLVKEGIAKIEPILEQQGIPCAVRLNCIVNKKGLWGLEWTLRFSYNLFDLMSDQLGDLLWRLGIGYGSLPIMQIETKSPFGVSITVMRDIVKEGVPLRTKTPRRTWLRDAVKTARGIETAGADNVIMTVTEMGSDITKAVANVYAEIRKIKLSDMDYRIDLGQKVKDDYNNLESLGWI